MAPSLFQVGSGKINLSGGGIHANLSIQIKTTGRNSTSHLALRGLLFIPLAFICLELSPALRAVSPPPSEAIPVSDTATGDNALKVNDNTQGQFNTAIGFNALQANTTGDHNTAFGLNTLLFNTTGTGNMGIGGGCLEITSPATTTLPLAFRR